MNIERDIGQLSIRPAGWSTWRVDPFAIGILRGWATVARKRGRMRTRREVNEMLSAAAFASIDWKPLVRVASLPVIYAVIARRSK